MSFRPRFSGGEIPCKDSAKGFLTQPAGFGMTALECCFQYNKLRKKMKVDFNKIYFGVKFVVIATFVALLAFLFWQKLAAGLANGGGIVYNVAPAATTKFVFGPYPEGRVEIIENAWKLKYEPIYFKVYAPRKFKKAEITLKYQNSMESDVFVGVKVKGDSPVPYYMKKLETTPSFDGAGSVEQSLQFDLAGAAIEKNKLQFIIAAPGVEESKESLIIENVKIQLL